MKLKLKLALAIGSVIWMLCVSVALAQENAIANAETQLEMPQDTLTNSVGMKLIPIPSGRFTMGSPPSEKGSQEDEVLHKVDLAQAFYMGATEVTEHQWAMVMEKSFSTELVEERDPETRRLIKKEERQIKNPKLDSQLPIKRVSWPQAVEFCKRLGDLPAEKKEGRVYRLPTEAEWEYACRAGTSTAYSFGDDASLLNEYAWHPENTNKTMPVAGKKPNAWGLYDMHGNVAEWCHDYYGGYPDSLVSSPFGPAQPETLFHVVRGGGIAGKSSQFRSGYRDKSSGNRQNIGIGFRVVSSAELPPKLMEDTTNSIGQRFVKIPSGTFTMGIRNNKIADDGDRAHKVELTKSFYIATTEVTQAQWQAVMSTKPWKSKDPQGDQIAATYVSWENAVDFCKRLSELEAEKAAGRVYRLPTEAEWEYACGASLSTEFNFGDDLNALQEYAWYESNAKSVQSVGTKEPNFWGLYDMHGNVKEWCFDWKDGYFPRGVVEFFMMSGQDPRGPTTGTSRVMRGGSWKSRSDECRSAVRDSDQPRHRSNEVGFRVVLFVESP